MNCLQSLPEWKKELAGRRAVLRKTFEETEKSTTQVEPNKVNGGSEDGSSRKVSLTTAVM